MAENERHNNEGKFSYKKGANQFSDLTNWEFKKIYLNSKIEMPKDLDPKRKYKKEFMLLEADAIDWRTEGTGTAVSHVKD